MTKPGDVDHFTRVSFFPPRWVLSHYKVHHIGALLRKNDVTLSGRDCLVELVALGYEDGWP